MKFLSYIGYLGFRFLLFIVKISPFWLLYFISDCFNVLIFRILRYRVKVININLSIAFPNLTNEEKSNIRHQFYRYFCDVFLESLKGYTMTPAQISARYVYTDEDRAIMKDFQQRHISVIIAYAHYGNWEWATQTVLYEGFQRMAALYKPMRNKYIDNYMRKLREHRGTLLYPISHAGYMFKKKNEESMGFVFLGDQNPPQKRSIWCTFLNRKTLCLHGIATYSKMFDLPVVYLESQMVKRGHYVQKLTTIVDNPQNFTNEEIIQSYMSAVEQSIKNAPAFWLWTHKRWKHVLKDDGTIEYGKIYK